MLIKPFRPLVPSSNEEASSLICPPYDTLSKHEARSYLKRSPKSFMSVIRPEASLPEDTPDYDASLYDAAAASMKSLTRSGRLVRAQSQTVYIYQQRAASHVQSGIVALTSATDYDHGVILRHEKTRPDKENDRTNLTRKLEANTGPVFLTYRDVDDITQLVADICKAPSAFDVTTEDDVSHTVWAVPEQLVAQLVQLFEQHVPVAYIADGHHRAASAATVAREYGESDATTKEDSQWFLSVLFPQTHLKILSYSRLIKDLNGHKSAEFLQLLETVGDLRRIETPQGAPNTPGNIFMFLRNHWFQLIFRPTEKNSDEAIDALDTNLLQKKVLQPILGIEDPRNSTRIDFAGGVRGLKHLEQQVSMGTAEVAFALCPVTVAQLMKVADSGEIMPPKSTWFEPKLRSGFFIHTFSTED